MYTVIYHLLGSWHYKTVYSYREFRLATLELDAAGIYWEFF